MQNGTDFVSVNLKNKKNKYFHNEHFQYFFYSSLLYVKDRQTLWRDLPLGFRVTNEQLP